MFRLLFISAAILSVCSVAVSASENPPSAQHGRIQLIVRGDDMGFCASANRACIKAYQQGILKSVEVIVPGPWFMDAVRLLKENPDLDAGVHLALTSEWDNYDWGPVTNSPSLTDTNGYFADTNEAFDELEIDPADVEAEFRAQIDLALKYIPQISHLSTHMGAPTSSPALNRIIEKLSMEYQLPAGPSGVSHYQSFWSVPAEQKEDSLASILENLEEGTTCFICHPALSTFETQAIAGSGMDPDAQMAIHRQAVTDALTSERIIQIIRDRKIRLISYADTFEPVSTGTDSGVTQSIIQK